MATFPQKQQSLKCLPNYKTSCQWWTNGVDKILFLLCKVKKIHHYCWSLFLISIPLIYLDCGTHSNVAFSIPSPQKHRCHTTMYVCMHYLTTPRPPCPPQGHLSTKTTSLSPQEVILDRLNCVRFTYVWKFIILFNKVFQYWPCSL